MIRHIPRNSRIFIGLVIITLLLTYLAITLSDYTMQLMENRVSYVERKQNHEDQTAKTYHVLSTQGWQSYQDHVFPLTFLCPKDWIVKSVADKNKDYIVTLTPPKSKTSITIFINKDAPVGFDGLNKRPYSLNGAKGAIVNDNLIGVKAGEYYYTFDATLVPEKTDEFATIISTVKFQ